MAHKKGRSVVTIEFENRSTQATNGLQEQQSQIVYDGRAWNGSPFVPMNAVSTPPDFTLETSANYIVMPAT